MHEPCEYKDMRSSPHIVLADRLTLFHSGGRLSPPFRLVLRKFRKPQSHCNANVQWHEKNNTTSKNISSHVDNVEMKLDLTKKQEMMMLMLCSDV